MVEVGGDPVVSNWVRSKWRNVNRGRNMGIRWNSVRITNPAAIVVAAAAIFEGWGVWVEHDDDRGSGRRRRRGGGYRQYKEVKEWEGTRSEPWSW